MFARRHLLNLLKSPSPPRRLLSESVPSKMKGPHPTVTFVSVPISMGVKYYAIFFYYFISCTMVKNSV